MVIPNRTLAQRQAALERANEVRFYRIGLKRNIKTNQLKVVDVLGLYDERAAGMKVINLLLAQKQWGRVKASEMLRKCGISQNKTIHGLTGRQRSELIHQLRQM